jgi:HAD superfamily hydrolase (TIGR01509 family)
LRNSFSPLRAIIFDCDGVLVDSEPIHYQAFQEVLRPLGLGYDYDRYVDHYIGFDDRDGFKEIFQEANHPLDSPSLTSLIHAKSEAFQHIVSQGISSFPGAISLVKELAAHGVPLAVASGSFRHEIHLFLKALGLREAFPIIVAADDVKRSKPDPETYLLVLQVLKRTLGWKDLDPQTCIAIEDTPAGIQAAKGADLYVIGVTHSYSVPYLQEADYVVESLTDLNPSKMIQLIKANHTS